MLFTHLFIVGHLRLSFEGQDIYIETTVYKSYCSK